MSMIPKPLIIPEFISGGDYKCGGILKQALDDK